MDYKPEHAPFFALLLRNSVLEVINEPIIAKSNNTRIRLHFNVVEDPLFVANWLVNGNFVIRYPKVTYDAFFAWLLYNGTTSDRILATEPLDYFADFAIDALVPSSRNLIDQKHLLQLLDHRKRLETVPVLRHCLWPQLQKICSCFQFHDQVNKQQKTLSDCYFKTAGMHARKESYSEDYCERWMKLNQNSFMIALNHRIYTKKGKFAKCINMTYKPSMETVHETNLGEQIIFFGETRFIYGHCRDFLLFIEIVLNFQSLTKENIYSFIAIVFNTAESKTETKNFTFDR